jgi:EmrB/QacA subfamily drug resistance transporter
VPHPATLPELQAHYGPRYRWLLLLAVMVGTMASIMSSTIINVAIPDMSHQFVLGQERAQWATSGFMAATTVAMLCTPWLLGAYGYRRTYVAAMVVLLLGGVGGGLANSFDLVLAARVVEGLAAGVVQPIPAIIIMRAFAAHERGRAGGVFGMGVVLAPALGPSIGGLLVDGFGWRSIFFMVVPFCLASVWLAYRYVPTTAPGGAAPDARAHRLDWQGLLLAGVGTLSLLNGMVELHVSASPSAGSLLALSLASFAAFVVWQRRQARRGDMPLMHPDLFAFRAFAMGGLVAFIYGIAMFGSTYLLPLYIQMAQQYSASHVGTIMLPAGLVLAVTIPIAGRLSDHWPIRVLICIGLALLALSFVLMLTLGPGLARPTLLAWLVAWVVVGRIGLGFILPSLNNGAMNGLEPRLISQASSAINFLRMLGGAVGVSLCGIVLEWRVAAHGDTLTRPEGSPGRTVAFDETFMMLAVVCVLAMLAAWQMRSPPRVAPLKQED